jgi:hypothetical protein
MQTLSRKSQTPRNAEKRQMFCVSVQGSVGLELDRSELYVYHIL